MIHLPILRHGVPYRSLDTIRVPHHRTREPFVEISQANAGLIRRDLRSESQEEARKALAAVPVRDLLAMCARAAEIFERDTLPVGDDGADAGRLSVSSCPPRPACRSSSSGGTCARLRRPDGDADGAARPDPRARPLHPGRRSRRARRPRHQLLPAHAGARRGAAQQLAGRPFALGSGHRAEDAARAEAGQRRAVDARTG